MRSTFISLAAIAAMTAAVPSGQTPAPGAKPAAATAKPAAGRTLDIYVSDTEGGKSTLFVTPNGETARRC
jgi:hypothetical protein